MRWSTMVLLGAGAAAAPVAAHAAGENSPAEVTTAIYHIYAGPKGDYQAGNLDDKRVAVYLSKSLRAALKAMDARSRKLNEPILDFDPVTDSQDPEVEKLTIAPEGDAAATAAAAKRTIVDPRKPRLPLFASAKLGAERRPSQPAPSPPHPSTRSPKAASQGETSGRTRVRAPRRRGRTQ